MGGGEHIATQVPEDGVFGRAARLLTAHRPLGENPTVTTEPRPPSPFSPRGSKDVVLAGVLVFVPALFAVAGAPNVPPVSADEQLVRVVGLGGTGPFRAADALIAAPFEPLPVGTPAFRASLAGAVLAGLVALLVFVLARGFLVRVFPRSDSVQGSSRGLEADLPLVFGRVPLASVLAWVAAWSVALGPALQHQASVPGGALLGAALVLGALACKLHNAHMSATAFVAGLAVSHSVPVAIVVLALVLPMFWGEISRYRARAEDEFGSSDELVRGALAFCLGLAPLVVGAAIEAREAASGIGSYAWGALGDSVARSSVFHGAAVSELASIAGRDVGLFTLAAAGAGVAKASTSRVARSWLLPFAGVLAAGVFVLLYVAVPGCASSGAVVLAAMALVPLLAVTGFAWAIGATARLPMPFADTSASLMVVLALVLPVRSADDTESARARAPSDLELRFSDAVWGEIAPGSVLLASDPRMLARVTAAHVTGHAPTGALVVPLYALNSPRAGAALRDEPLLASLYRDVALGSAPEELSLSTVAAARPVVVPFDASWSAEHARHLLPSGLALTYAQEPRGPSDRRRAIEAGSSLARSLAKDLHGDTISELAMLLARQLRERALAMAAASDRVAAGQATEDLSATFPDDPVAHGLTRLLITTKGTIDLRDLRGL